MGESGLSKNLRELMINNGNLTEAELSEVTGIPQPTLNHILTSKTKRPRKDCLEKLSTFFSVGIDFLINEKQEKKIDGGTTKKKIPFLDKNSIGDFFNDPLNFKTERTLITETGILGLSFAIVADDSSMDPIFPEKTVLIFDTGKEIHDRCYALILDRSGVYLFRQIILNGTTIFIKAINPDISNYLREISVEEKIIGVLIQSNMYF